MQVVGVDPIPDRRIPLDQIDHGEFIQAIIATAVEVGVIPYRERYEVRFT
jgi:hypothetical protein